MARSQRQLTSTLIGLVVITLLLLSACAQGPAAPVAPPEDTTGEQPAEAVATEEEMAAPAEEEITAAADELIIAQPASVQFVDPQRTYLSTEAAVWHSMYDTLAYRLPDLTIGPGLAKSWEQESDTEWILELQEGVNFHNGEPFNAEVVKWNVERVIVPGFQDYAYLSAYLAGAEVVDEYTVKIITQDVLPTMPGLLAVFMMVPPDYMEEVGIEGYNEAPVGTGPYQFVEWVKDSHITLEANPNYWNDVHAPTFGRVTWRFLPSDSTRIAALRAGEVHIVKDLPPDDFVPVDNDPNLEAVWTRSLRTPFFRFFPASPQGGGEPFEDVQVRRAVNHAINVPAMMEGLLGGRGFRTATLMTPDFAGYDPSVEPYEYDPERAKELLEEAGYADGFEITFETWSAGPAPKPLELAQVAANDLEQVGITANVVPLELGTALNMQNESRLSPFHLWSWGAGQIDCRDKFWGVFHPDSSATFLVDEQVVEWIDEIDVTVDQEERNQVCSALQARVHELAMIVPLFAQPDLYGKTTDVNWEPRSDELILPWEVTPAQ